MKSTNHFKNTISAYLEKRANDDVLFMFAYSKPNKNINDCITYILNTVKKSGCNGFTDDEIYSMAVHYYDEDNIDVGKAIKCNVVVNHTVQLTEEEKQQARKDAIQRAQDEAYNKMKQPARKTIAQTAANQMNNLFNF
jgi:hypothetical protein